MKTLEVYRLTVPAYYKEGCSVKLEFKKETLEPCDKLNYYHARKKADEKYEELRKKLRERRKQPKGSYRRKFNRSRYELSIKNQRQDPRQGPEGRKAVEPVEEDKS